MFLLVLVIMFIILSSVSIYAYKKYPYTKDKLYSYFLPINDSLFENIKLLWTSYMLVGMFFYLIFYNFLPLSYMFGLFVSALLAIIMLSFFLSIIDFVKATSFLTTVLAYIGANGVAASANFYILMTNYQNYYIIMSSIVASILITGIMAYFTYDNIAAELAWEEN